MIKDSSVQAVLEAANIVDVISGYTSLRKRVSPTRASAPSIRRRPRRSR